MATRRIVLLCAALFFTLEFAAATSARANDDLKTNQVAQAQAAGKPAAADHSANPRDGTGGAAAGVNASLEKSADFQFGGLLIPAFLALLLPAGFALIACGMCRAKNSAHTFTISLMIVPLSGIAFFLFGFALAFGNAAHGSLPPGAETILGGIASPLDGGVGIGASADVPGKYTFGITGAKGFCLAGISDPAVLSVFCFTMALAIAAASIPAGAMAERWAWKNFMLYGLWFVVPFALFANWIWGGGWLAQMGANWGWGHGAVDFAGSGAIQALAGTIALAGAICIGPRLGKYVGGRARAMPGHSVPFVVLGTFVLMFAWYGLHAGAMSAGGDLPISEMVVNTALASFCGALGAVLLLLARSYKPDPTLLCNGFIAGLAAISAACPFVDHWAAMLIGAVAGVLVSQSIYFWDKIGVDDPVGSISMHGVSGLWGFIALGLFANGKYGVGWNGVLRSDFAQGGDGVRGWFYGDSGQLVAQLVAAGVLIVFGFAVAYLCFKLSDWITPLRTSRDAELKGLDNAELGTLVYPDFTLKSGTLDG